MLQWRGNNGEPQSNVSADFERALTREILRTELLRVRTILATLTVLLTGMLGAYALLPRVSGSGMASSRSCLCSRCFYCSRCSNYRCCG
jgi:hypothetical protein